jgi:hypothetical protein
MQSKPIWDYIGFGTCIRYLQDVEEGHPVHGDTRILDNLERFFDYLETLNLTVTQRASEDLMDFYRELKKTEQKHVLTVAEAKKLSDLVTGIRKTLSAEARGKVAFIATDKRIDLNKLLWDVPSLLPKNVFQKLPEISQYDLIEACKCIAYERPTAAAFHLLRGTEGVLREYYKTIVKRGRISDSSWGPILTSLKGLKKNRPSNEILDNLTSIKNNYRNPTQHPDKIYDIEEVQNLFGVCIDAINRMAQSFK